MWLHWPGLQWLYDDDDVEGTAAAGSEARRRLRVRQERREGGREAKEGEREAIETVDAPLIFSLIG